MSVQRALCHVHKYINLTLKPKQKLTVDRNLFLQHDCNSSQFMYYEMRKAINFAMSTHKHDKIRFLSNRCISLVKVTSYLQCLPRDVNRILDECDLYLLCLNWEEHQDDLELSMVLKMPRVINITSTQYDWEEDEAEEAEEEITWSKLS